MNKQTLIDNLNEDLAGELSAIIQYLTYAAKATGPYRPQLVQFFMAEVADEQLHAQFLANKGTKHIRAEIYAKGRPQLSFSLLNQIAIENIFPIKNHIFPTNRADMLQ